MKFVVLYVGSSGGSWAEQAVQDYLHRFPKEYQLQMHCVKKVVRSSRSCVEQVLSLEANRVREMLKRWPAHALVVLDEKGPLLSTVEFSGMVERFQVQAHPTLVFLIGSSDGIHPALKQSGSRCLSLSKMTFPHHLARVLLVEQLYRVVSIFNQHPYHRL